MATANAANVIEWGKYNYGAPITTWTITAAADVSAEVNPGEELGQILECVSQHGTIIGLSNHSSGGTVFSVAVENNSWADAAALQTALQALSLSIAGAMTVA